MKVGALVKIREYFANKDAVHMGGLSWKRFRPEDIGIVVSMFHKPSPLGGVITFCKVNWDDGITTDTQSYKLRVV